MNDKNKKPEGKNKNKNSSSSPKIVTLDSIRSNEDSSRQAFFAGGSLSSGQQILGNDLNNPNLSHIREQLLNTFRAASVGNNQGHGSTRENGSFSGIGHKLGSTESVSNETHGSSQDVTDQTGPVNVTLTLWENGYNVDDGPLRSYEGLSTKDIIMQIVSGLNTANPVNPHIDLTVIDNTSQQHTETLATFGGTGYILGGLTPTLTTNMKNDIDRSCETSGLDSYSDEGNVDGELRRSALERMSPFIGGNVDEESRNRDLSSFSTVEDYTTGQTQKSMNIVGNETSETTESGSNNKLIYNTSNREISAVVEESQNAFIKSTEAKNSSALVNNPSSSSESIDAQPSVTSNPLEGLPDDPLSEEYISSLDFEDVPVKLDETGNFGGFQGYILNSQLNSPDNLPANVTVGRGIRKEKTFKFNVSSRTDFSDGTERIINLKIRVPDGQTFQLTVNASSTISQVKEYIKECIQNLANTVFSLHLIYPKRELQNHELVDSEEINNAVLTIRF